MADAGLTLITAVQRFVKVWRQASAAAQARRPQGRLTAPATFEPAAVAARWRAWREANGWTPRTGRYTGGTRRAGAAGRWHERRQARLSGPIIWNDSTAPLGASVPNLRRRSDGRAGRSGTRRP